MKSCEFTGIQEGTLVEQLNGGKNVIAWLKKIRRQKERERSRKDEERGSS
jgi:hypothetical protein